MPVVVITGASAGVGRVTANIFAEHGYDVGLLARGEAGLKATAAEIESKGRRAVAVPTDVASWEDVDAAATRIEAELGPIDVWVNNAMTTVFGTVADVGSDEIRRATEVTYLGQVHGTLAALERMRPRDRGRIVNVGSALAFIGIPLQAAYCGAKFATRGFTESVRAELLADGSHVTISQVHLPAINTPQFEWCKSKMTKKAMPVAPVYDPDLAAGKILDAARRGQRSEMVGAWNSLLVTMGQLLPGLVSHYAANTAVDGQQTDEPEDPNRPSNLWEPVDDDHDVGPRGRFGDRSRGVLTPSFLLSLPKVVVDVGIAAAHQAREVLSLARAR